MYTDMTKVEKCRLQNEADFVTEWHTVFSSKAGQNGRKGALCDNLPTSL